MASGIDEERRAISWSGYAGSKSIIGWLHDESFRLQKRRYRRSGFAPFFYGEFVPSGRDTLIEGEFRTNPPLRVFWIVWFSFLAVLSVIKFVVEGNLVLALVIPAGLGVFGVALVRLDVWLGRSEERAIVEFIKSTFEADDAG